MSFLDELGKLNLNTASDLTRIKSLPSRDYTPEQLDQLVEQYTALLKKPTGTMRLRPIQALALHECTLANGLVGFMRVASGKSLTTLLIPRVVTCNKVVLLVPPDLKAKLIKHDYPAMAKHWELPSLDGHTFIPGRPTIYPVAYSELSSQKNADVLERIKPDLIICDEAHTFASPGFSSRKARFKRYLKANPATRLYLLSGTLLKKSIVDLAPLVKLVLGDGSPFPLDFHTLVAWGAVLDPEDRRTGEQEHWRLEEARKELAQLAAFDQTGQIGDLRQIFQKRLFSTPGIIRSSGRRECDAGFLFHERPLKTPPEVADALANLRKTWALGDELYTDKIEVSRAARQLAAGLYTRWIWPKNEPVPLRKAWLNARSAYLREERDYLEHRAKPGSDSPLLVKQALAAERLSKVREFKLYQTWAEWREIEPTCEPKPDVVWVSDYLIKDAVAWGKKHVGLIWYWHHALGPKLAEAGGFPLYAGAEDAAALLEEKGDRTIVLSMGSFYKGQNLQAYSKQLLTYTTGNDVLMQQLLGRTAREGQKADNIETWVYRHTPELRDAWERAKVASRAKVSLLGDELFLLLGSETWTE